MMSPSATNNFLKYSKKSLKKLKCCTEKYSIFYTLAKEEEKNDMRPI